MKYPAKMQKVSIFGAALPTLRSVLNRCDISITNGLKSLLM